MKHRAASAARPGKEAARQGQDDGATSAPRGVVLRWARDIAAGGDRLAAVEASDRRFTRTDAPSPRAQRRRQERVLRYLACPGVRQHVAALCGLAGNYDGAILVLALGLLVDGAHGGAPRDADKRMREAPRALTTLSDRERPKGVSPTAPRRRDDARPAAVASGTDPQRPAPPLDGGSCGRGRRDRRLEPDVHGGLRPGSSRKRRAWGARPRSHLS